MAITFAVRGDSLNARYSNAGKTPGNFNSEVAVVSSGAGFDQNYLNFSANGNNKGLYYPGRTNLPSGRACSILIRCTLEDLGSFMGLWDFGGPHALEVGRFSLVKSNSTTLNTNMFGETGSALINNVTKTWSPTISTIYDIVMVTPGDTTSNGTILYIDGVSIGTFTPGGSWPATRNRDLLSHICLGQTNAVSYSRIKVYEFVIWDSVIDPTSVALTSGTGSLNGASRTAFVDVASFDGDAYSDPGATNVKSAIGYTYAGTSYTGSYLWSTVAASDIRLNTSYIANGVTITGSLAVGNWSTVTASDVRSGVSYIANDITTTGTYLNTTISAADVRLGTSVITDSQTITGTLVVPTPGSGTAGTILLHDIKENIRYILDQANTTTASPVYLSNGLVNPVNKILKVNPEMIRPQASFFPLVTCYITDKPIVSTDIAKSQLNHKRRAKVNVNIVGSIWNNNMVLATEDPADEDINYLMENIELTLRAYYNLNGVVNWQTAKECTYYTTALDEQTHLRSGILKIECDVFY